MPGTLITRPNGAHSVLDLREAPTGPAPAQAGLTTLSVFHFPPGQRLWAFAQMGLARRTLARVPGLRFWRLLGSGQGGFGLWPDFGRYGLLAVWDGPAHADEFFAGPALRAFSRRADEEWTVRLLPVTSKGQWAGANPFSVARERPSPAGPVAILTRATLRLSRLGAFWRAVPAASAALDAAEGRLCSVGIGELPFVQQATFSLWRSFDDVKRFAYARGCPHRDIVRRTREERWYAEDLFARFVPLSSEGTLAGRDPLRGLL